LVQLTHNRGLIGNSHVHYKKLEGLTKEQHKEIFDQVRDLMFTDPAELLPKHQHLLEVDFAQLGDRSTADRQYWVESMESALESTDHIVDGGIIEDIRKALQPSKRKHQKDTSPTISLQQRDEDKGYIVYQPYWFGQANFLFHKRTIREDHLSGSVPVLCLWCKRKTKAMSAPYKTI